MKNGGSTWKRKFKIAEFKLLIEILNWVKLIFDNLIIVINNILL